MKMKCSLEPGEITKLIMSELDRRGVKWSNLRPVVAQYPGNDNRPVFEGYTFDVEFVHLTTTSV
jgi:hypothetical protein